MLNWLIEKTAATAKELVNAVEETANYAYEEITSIPDSIEKGWDTGLFSKDSAEETVVEKDSTDTPDETKED